MSIQTKFFSKSKFEFKMFTMTRLAEKELEKGKDVIQLTVGIPEVVLDEEVLAEIEDRARDFSSTQMVFPDGIPVLRNAIAEYYNRRLSESSFSVSNVIVSTGTSTIFRNLLYLLVGRGKEILIPRPYYCLYLMSAQLSGRKVKFYDIDLATGRIDFESFERNYSPERTAAVVVNSPGNPLGNLVSRQELERISSIVKNSSYVIFDEIYENIIFNDNTYAKPDVIFPFSNGNVIYTNSFSKGYGMYTKRVGYCLAPSKIIEYMKIIQEHTLLTSDPVNQFAAIKALEDQKYVLRLRESYNRRANYAAQRLEKSGFRFFMPQGGFYFTLFWETGLTNDTSFEVAKKILNEVGVASVPGSDFGMRNALRLSFCNSRFNEGIDKLYAFSASRKNVFS